MQEISKKKLQITRIESILAESTLSLTTPASIDHAYNAFPENENGGDSVGACGGAPCGACGACRECWEGIGWGRRTGRVLRKGR